jgi:hypothetical protein
MRRHLFDLTVLFVVASVVAVYLALAQPAVREIALRSYVFVVGGLLMLAIVAAAGDAVPRRRRSELDLALSRADAGPDRRLPELEKLEREVTLAAATAFDLHQRLLPQLREIAQARLERSGRQASEETLGRWWELLRPDREAPEDRFGPGITQAQLRELVADLERM